MALSNAMLLLLTSGIDVEFDNTACDVESMLIFSNNFFAKRIKMIDIFDDCSVSCGSFQDRIVIIFNRTKIISHCCLLFFVKHIRSSNKKTCYVLLK